jgi:hypothetical protein
MRRLSRGVANDGEAEGAADGVCPLQADLPHTHLFDPSSMRITPWSSKEDQAGQQRSYLSVV